MTECIFCKIIKKQIPAKIMYEDEQMLAFYDINPKADIHFLIIPKEHIDSMLQLKDMHQQLIGLIMLKANELAIKLGLDGYKVQVNVGISGGQEVFHLHVHVLGNIKKG
jgi:histidine triad (HIT) family protein